MAGLNRKIRRMEVHQEINLSRAEGVPFLDKKIQKLLQLSAEPVLTGQEGLSAACLVFIRPGV
jgi:hypothetical protein